MKNINIKIVALNALFLFSVAVIGDPLRWSYQLHAGETLADVCEDQVAMSVAICVVKLKKYNNLSSTNPKAGTQFKIPVVWLREERVGVKVISAFGEVYFKNNKAKDWQALKDKKMFFAQEQLSTKKGNVILKFYDNSEVEVSPDSELLFSVLEIGGQSTGRIQLLLNKGRIDNHIQKRQQDTFKIQTPAGIAAVRGTSFRVRLTDDNKSMYSEVLGGQVAIESDNQSAVVEKDFGIKATQHVGLSEKRRLLEPPVLLNNPADSTKMRIVRVEWQPLEKAREYQYELYEGEQLLLKESTQETNVALSILRPSQYHVVIRGVDADGYAGKDTDVEFMLAP